jgi:hypothetical protein
MLQFIGIDKWDLSWDYDCVTKWYMDEDGILWVTDITLSNNQY